jgi:hypothetical protein
MSVHGMKPQFKDYEGYIAWRSEWRKLYAYASLDIRQSRAKIKSLSKELEEHQDEDGPYEGYAEIAQELRRQQREHPYKKVTARKLLTVLEEAKIHWQNIKNMKKGIKEQFKEYPLEVESKNIDFHFNKKSMEHEFIPMWVVKAKGKTYYVHHMECLAGFTTRETPDNPKTKGSLRVKRGTLVIDAEGNAVIR